ncbi:MAG: ATP-dependent sacrificial sulfur transferase LarE [Actinomycetota bacterium]|nr:ATP-dependent sacrificial sulfur transferase LarE [Actinomycetota bacterium]
MDTSLIDKRDRLHRVLETMERVLIGYSGGVDSTFLMASAHEALGDRAWAVTAVSPSLARRELDEARSIARRFGWNHETVRTREVSQEEYARNDSDRCYHCKVELFEVLAPKARTLHAEIAVGTNTDDLGDYRPGLRAARERGVRAPLVEAELSKADVRELSGSLGLPTADKPSSPCLASRFAYGVRVTAEGLRRVERAEEIVRSHGFDVLRVRDHGDLARIEVPVEDVPRAAALQDEIFPALRALGFRYVTLDLAGFRSGSLNAVLQPPHIGSPPE